MSPSRSRFGLEPVLEFVMDTKKIGFAHIACFDPANKFRDTKQMPQSERHLMQLARRLGSSGHRFRFAYCASKRFLAKDMLSMLDREEGMLQVKSGRGAYRNGIHFRMRAQLRRIRRGKRNTKAVCNGLGPRKLAATNPYNGCLRMAE
jgi:hypothetical protein